MRDVLAVTVLAAFLAAAPAATQYVPPEDADAVVSDLAQASLDTTAPRSLRGVRLDTGGAFVLDLHEGVLFPVTTPAGRVLEMVFLGRGRVRLDPPDEVEAGQLELFTGSASLDEGFTAAILVVAKDDAREALLGRPPAEVDPELPRRAEEHWRRWRESPERRLLGVGAGLLADALGDPPTADGYFSAWFAGQELGEFLLLYDPAADEPLRLGQFVPYEVSGRQKRRLSRALDREQRRGRLLGFDVPDLGTWDTWISAGTGPAGSGPAEAAFEPRHYTLDVTVRPKDGALAGRAVIDLEARAGGRRGVRLSLHHDLAVANVTHLGRELPLLREGDELTAVLHHVPPAGARLSLEITWSGHFLDPGRAGNWALRDGLAWYPHAGELDRATYDVTVRRPPQVDLLAAGRWVASGEEDGLRWDRRRLDVPALGFGFEVGRFELERTRAGRVAVTVAFDPSLVEVTNGDLADVSFAVTDSLRFYETLFGPYPLDELVVVTTPRDYSQAMPGFVTLSNAMMVDWGDFGNLLGFTDRRAVVAHEIAHQWWGHLVGWRSYRDQWISEAMANYASLLWTERRLGGLAGLGPTSGWQEELTAPAEDGRPVEALGPLVMGLRLDSSRGGGAYEAIVYRKGAVVLGMLATAVGGEKRFLGLLRSIAAPRVLSTEDLLRLLEEGSGVDLDDFAERLVYGTGLPQVYYTSDVREEGDGKYRVRLAARQETPYHFHYRVVELESGDFDVARRRHDQMDVETSHLVVPFTVTFAGSPTALEGRMELRGVSSELSFELDQEPRDVLLDVHRKVFGRFWNERLHPKRGLLAQGLDAASTGRAGEAEVLLLTALDAATPPQDDSSRELEALRQLADRLLDARVRLELARLELDRGRPEAARRHFEAASHGLRSSERELLAGELELVEARLAILRGDVQEAFKRLRKTILKDHRPTTPEGWLLLAIAAHRTGHPRELEDALAAARRRGADASLLVAP